MVFIYLKRTRFQENVILLLLYKFGCFIDWAGDVSVSNEMLHNYKLLYNYSIQFIFHVFTSGRKMPIMLLKSGFS